MELKQKIEQGLCLIQAKIRYNDFNHDQDYGLHTKITDCNLPSVRFLPGLNINGEILGGIKSHVVCAETFMPYWLLHL